MKINFGIKKFIIIFMVFAFGLGATNISAQQFAAIGEGMLHILGIALSVDPAQQTAPVNMETAVNTELLLPDVDLGGDIPGVSQDLVVVAELTGPGIREPITISAMPGEQLMIPPLPQEGTYVLDNIRLMSGDQVVLYAEPSVALIDTIRKLLITQVTSRALSIDEIEELGITINPENFTAYKFTVGFGTESGEVKMEIPVVMDLTKDKNEEITSYVVKAKLPSKDVNPVPKLKVPNLQVTGFAMLPELVTDITGGSYTLPPIAGAIVIPGDIAFLNQFFEVMLLITNNAPEGTPLTVTDISAEVFFPPGDDNIPDTPDDPLRIAQTDNGAGSIVPVINTTGGESDLSAKESGEGRFLVEGLREGTHQISIDITGTLLGLPSGPVGLKGQAKGTVIVRNPYFSLAFGQPDVVREGEEYSLYVTVNNTSEVSANLASLSLPPNEVYGATIIGDSDPATPVGTVQFRTIEAGDSGVAEFRLIARKTGRVTSTAFVGDEGAKGVFQLRTGVDERGVPLSPDTIIISEYTKNLPEDFLYHAMRVLGLAHGVATAPALPPDVTRIPKANVAKRAYELTEAGLRIKLGESLENSVSDLLMDWLGNGFRDKGFEEILRTTGAGKDFLAEAGKIIGIADSMSIQRSFGEVVKYRSPFISAVLENKATGQASAYLEIIDDNDRSTGRVNNGSAVRDIPFGVLVDLDGDPDRALSDMVLLDSQTDSSYDLYIKGMSTGYINFGLIMPDENGGYIHAVYRDIQINAGETITGRITTGTQVPVLRLDSLNIYPSEVYAYAFSTGPKVISAMQLPEADLRDRGRVIAVLFDEKIDTESANNSDNYEVVYRTLSRELINPPKLVKILPGRRIIQVMFQSTISPFFEYDLILSGINDPDFNPQNPDPVRVPIITTLTRPGGIVSGTVRKGNGDPIPFTEVILRETFIDSGGPFPVITNRTVTDAEGNYQLDYVAMGKSFRVESSDPETGQEGDVTSRIIMDRQHLKLDILLLGLGTLTGQVVRAEDASLVEDAVVTISSLTSSSVFFAKTGADGRFSISIVPVGNLNVKAEFEDFKGAIGAYVPQAGATLDITIPVYSILRDTGSVKGRVFASDGKTPIEGVPVIIKGDMYQNWISTDANGNYLIEDVPAGSIFVRSFMQETGEEAEAGVTVESSQTTTVNLVFPGTAKIIGTVYDQTGLPLAGADLISGITLVKTDENGNFVIENVPVGKVDVMAWHPEADLRAGASVKIGSPGEVVRLNITFAELDSKKGTIQGYARDAYGNPLTYQRISFLAGQRSSLTATDGRGFYTIELPLDIYKVSAVNAAGTDADVKQVRLVVDSQVATIDLRFKGFSRITGTVYQPDGESPTVASVIFTRKMFTVWGNEFTTEERYLSDQLTDAGVAGRYTIAKTRIGDYRLKALSAFNSQPVVYNGKINNTDETVIVDIVLQPTSIVRGQIFLASGDRAGAGLPVTLKSITIDEMQVTTLEDGTFEFNLVPPEQFTLEVYDPITGNYGVARGSVETGDDAVVDVHILGKGTVNVKVIDGTGDPIPNAKLKLKSGSPVAYLTREFPDFYTDQNGEAVYRYVPEGAFSVTAEDSGTLTGGRSGGTIPEDLTEVDVTVIVSSSGTVTGTVYTADETGTMPFAQVKLVSRGRPDFFTTTDSEGNYTFDYVPLGAFSLEVFHSGTGRVGKAEGSINYDTHVVEVDVRIIAQGTVEGYVYTASGEPVSTAKVTVRSNAISGFEPIIMTSNLEGGFKVSGIPSGKYTVKADDLERNLSGMSEGEIISENEVVQTDVYLEATGGIFGRTFAANGVTPSPYAEVKISGRNYSGSAVTDADGNFAFETVPLGTYDLVAKEQNGFDGGAVSAITVDYEEHLSQADIVFIGTGNIIGRVINTDGTPLESEAKLTLRRKGILTKGFTAYTDLDGNFAFYGIPTGEFSITTKVPGSLLGGTYSDSLDEDGTSLEDVLIELEPSGEIHGTVFREDGVTAVKDALVTCRVKKSLFKWLIVYAATGEDGSFAIAGIPLGELRLNFQDYTSGGSGTASGILTETANIVNFGSIVLDEKTPYVVNTTPVSGAVQVPLDSVITIEFSEPVDIDSVNSNNIKITGASLSVPGDLSLSDDRTTVTFTPSSGLPEFVTVTVTVKAIKDDRGKTMDDMLVSRFTTADITPPGVLSARLIKGAFVAEFSEPVIPESGIFSVTYSDSGAPVEGILTFSAGDMVATLYPSNELPDDTVFDLLISEYTDSFGNVQEIEFRGIYRTGDKIPPAVSLASSAPVVIEGTPVTITALPLNSPDIYTVDYRINGYLVETVNRSPFAMTMRPIETVTVTAVPVDYAGNVGEEISITVNVIPNMPPTSTILSPVDGDIFGTGRRVIVRGEATDDLGLKEIEMRVRSTDVSLTRVYKVLPSALSESYYFYFDIPSTSEPGMEIVVEVIARDTRNVESEPSFITIYTEDTTKPVVQITSFKKGFQVAPGEVIPVTVYASDNAAISRIDFITEGGLQLSETYQVDPASSEVIASFTLEVPEDYSGGTQITVAPSATDVNGNVGYAPKITLITDDIAPPTIEILSPSDASSVMARDTVRIIASTTDNDLIERVDFFIDGVLFATDRVSAQGFLYDASFLVPAAEGTILNLSARTYDVSGNSSELASVSVGVEKDTIPPELTMVSKPENIRFAEGHSVSIIVDVADNIGVLSAELFVNGAVVSTFEKPASKSLTFDYTVENLIPDGLDSVIVPLEIRATDFDGNEGGSGIYQVEIVPDNPPVVSIVSLKPGQNVLGGSKIHIEAEATDDFAIQSIEIKVNGISLLQGNGVTVTADYEIPGSALGSTVNIEAIAVDTLGNLSSSSTTVNVPVSISMISELLTGEQVTDMALYSGYAYILEQGVGVSVLDVRDVSTPVKIASLALPGDYSAIDTFEGVIYVYGTYGLTLIDTVDPSNPVIISNYETSAPVMDIAFRAGYAYCAMGFEGLLVLDIHNPEMPGGLAYDITGVYNVDTEGDYLFIAGQTGNPLRVYTLDDPINPVFLDSYGLGPVNSFDYEGSTGVGITGDNRLTSFAYDEASGFSRFSDIVLDENSAVTAIDLKGHYAVHSSGPEGWGIIEVSRDGSLYNMGSILSGGNTSKAILQGGYVFSADGSDGFRIYKINTLNTIYPEAQITSPVSGSSIEEGAEIEVRANVSNGENASVTFFVDGKEVFIDETTPYTYRFRVPRDVMSITIKAKASNLNGLYAESSEVVLNVIEETVPPDLIVTDPPQDGTITNFIEGEILYVDGYAEDDLGIEKVELFVDSNLVDHTPLPDFGLEYLIPNDGLDGTDYEAEAMVRATDVSGNVTEIVFNFRVVEDLPPQITFITPQPDVEVFGGTIISLNVNAIDDIAVEEVRFYEDSTLLGTGLLSSENVYSILYRVPDVTQNETRTFKAEATDSVGQTVIAETSIIVIPSQAGPVISVGDNASTLDVRGDIAVTGASDGMLRLYNIGVPTAPVLVGSMNFNLNEEIRQVRIKGSRVYAATKQYMRIIDIADPANPVLLSSTSNYLYTIDVFEDVAFAGRNSGLLYVYDLSDGENPVRKLLKGLGSGDIRDLKIDEQTGILYAVVDYGINSYLSVLDANDITDLVEIARVTLPGNPRGIEIFGDKAYIANTLGMLIVDISYLADPYILGSIDIPGTATDLEILGNRAYVVNGDTLGFTTIDITDPQMPLHEASIETPGSAIGVKIAKGMAFIADGTAGLTVIELGDTPPLVRKDLISISKVNIDDTVDVIGLPMAVTDEDSTVRISITNLSTGTTVESDITSGSGFSLNIAASTSDELVFEAFDSHQSSGPIYLGQVSAGDVVSGYPVTGSARAVDVNGDIAVIGEQEGTLTLFDIVDPLNPLMLGSMNFNLNEEIRQVRIKGSRVYAVTKQYMRIIDIADPANPVLLSSTSNYLYTIDVFEDVAFAGRNSGLLYVYDVSDGENPVRKLLKGLGSGDIRDLKIDEQTGILYAVVDYGINSYLSVLDANDITDLVEIARVTLPGNPRGIEVVGNEVYIAVSSGMVIVSLSRVGTVEFGTDGDGDGLADDILSYFETTGGAYDIDIKGNYAYLADGLFNGVSVIDITDPAIPQEIGNIDTPGDAVDLKIAGDYLYLADGYAGLSIVELY